MSRFSNVAVVLAVGWIAAAGPYASAQAVFLGETNLRDACFSNEMSMKLTGTISVVQNGQNVEHPAHGGGDARLLRALPRRQGRGRRTDRSLLQPGRGEHHGRPATSPRSSSRRTTRCSSPIALKDRLLVYHPTDVLTREEIDVTSHFDSMSVPGLLPKREVKVGDTWIVPHEVVQALTDLDAVSKCDVTGKFESVVGNFANLSFNGARRGNLRRRVGQGRDQGLVGRVQSREAPAGAGGMADSATSASRARSVRLFPATSRSR